MATNNLNMQGLTQVSSDLLHTLVNSVDALRNDVSQLRAENASLSSKLETVLAHQPQPRFPQFSDLPMEIRRIIWRHALTTPQININRGEIYQSQQSQCSNAIMQRSAR
jgi:hypothetical protein